MKSLAGSLALKRGGRYEGQGLKIGYFAQHQLEQLRPEESCLQHFKRQDPLTREQEFRDFLGGFDFRGDRVNEPDETFHVDLSDVTGASIGAARGTATIADDEAITALAEARKDQEVSVRRSVVRSLDALRPAPGTIPALIAALDDPDEETARLASAALKTARFAKEDIAALGNMLSQGEANGRASAAAFLAALGPDARRLLVHHYEPAWHDIGIVRNYIRRLLDAVPETQQVIDHIHWAEGPPVEIIAFVEFQNGKRRPMEIGNGYAHFEDLGGCEWWARYLGGERSKWVVRP